MKRARPGPSRRSAAWWTLITVGVLAAVAPLLPLQDPARPDLDRKLAGPCAPAFTNGWEAPPAERVGTVAGWLGAMRETCFGDRQLTPVLGTDMLGRCVLARILWGARISLLVGLVASVISLGIGVTYGAVSGLAGGRVDRLMMRLVDVFQALPLMFIVIFMVTFLRGVQAHDPDFPLTSETVLFAVIGAVSWLIMARMVRGQVLAVRAMPFIDAARAGGASWSGILARHVIPNVMPLVIVTLTLTVPRVILLEAFLSFLGLGIDAPNVSWGLLAREGFDAITAVHVSWWLLVFPGLVLGLTLHALNSLGDGLRDALDPLLRGTTSETGEAS